MLINRCLLILLFSFSSLSWSQEIKVRIVTSLGEIIVQLDPNRAPISSENFLNYVESEAYSGTVFHRVIPGFMIQGGGHFSDMSEAEEGGLIFNEAANGLKNTRGTIAMARMNAIDSASRQFFINVADNEFLNHQGKASCTRDQEKTQLAAQSRGIYRPNRCKSYGYAVFGYVVKGMEVVDLIEDVETGKKNQFSDVPLKPVVISKMEVL